MHLSQSSLLSFSYYAVVTASLFTAQGYALPQQRNNGGNNRGNGATRGATAQQRAAQIPGGISTATDGTTILDQTVQINNLPIRFKISAPADQFTTASKVSGATASPNTAGSSGLNVLLHGDGGQSFFDFPNQGALPGPDQSTLLGVTVLAPDPNLFWGGGAGLQRTEGAAHAQAVADLITTTLPQLVAFNSSNVFFTGVSGGSLMLSGFFIPAQMGQFPNTGVLLNCGALSPQVAFTAESKAALANTRVHFQSTQQELADLQVSIPESIKAYEQATAEAISANAGGGNVKAADVNALLTADSSPNGGHCEFDAKGFVSGVQLMADSFAAVMLNGGDGLVGGVDVRKGVVGNENLGFAAAAGNGGNRAAGGGNGRNAGNAAAGGNRAGNNAGTNAGANRAAGGNTNGNGNGRNRNQQ